MAAPIQSRYSTREQVVNHTPFVISSAVPHPFVASSHQHSLPALLFAGTHRCDCPPGWTGASCSSDVNECEEQQPCMDAADCDNLEGSFECICANGTLGQCGLIHFRIAMFGGLMEVAFSALRGFGENVRPLIPHLRFFFFNRWRLARAH